MFLVIFCLLISLLVLEGYYCLFWWVNIYGVYPLYIFCCLECTLVAARESRWQGCPAVARGRCREFCNDSNVVDRVEQCTSVDEPLAETAATTACNIEQNRAGSVGESASVLVGSSGSRARAVG